MPRMVLLPLNSCEEKRGANSSRCRRQWRVWAIMALRVLFFIILLVLADAQKWPVSGDCQPCQCSYKITSFGRMRTVNCSRRGLAAIPTGLPDDLMALDLSWNSLDPQQLRQQLCKFQSLRSVSLAFADLTTLSDILEECSSVLELNLTGNRLTQVDSTTFMGLKNLRRLLGLEVESVVSRDVFKQLTNLKDLDVIFHGVTLPKGLFDDLVIQSLNLVVTQASSLPQSVFEFGQKTLNTLQLIGERITQVDEDLLNGLSVLKKLYLVMPSVQRLPERFFHSQQFQPSDSTVRLANLQEVEISGIQRLPAMLFNKLVTLETLQLTDIGSFPQMGFLDGAVNLRTLLITGSRLPSIPAGWFKQLYSLVTLTLSGLQVESLHERVFQGLMNLNYLDLSNNKLDHITAKMLMPLNKTLETLILRGNLLTEINKDVLGRLGSLRQLDVGENRLTNVYSNSFVGMTYLSVLYLNNNRLTSLPSNIFRDLLQLESMSLSDNYLVEFPKAILQLNGSLISLDLTSNELREVPAFQLCRFMYLQVLDITNNMLHCDCPLLALRQCPQITVNGQCKSPSQYLDMSIGDIDVPAGFCVEKVETKEMTSGPQSHILNTTPSAVVNDNSVSHSPQTDQLNIKVTTIMPEAAAVPPVNVLHNSSVNQNSSVTSTAKADLAAPTPGQITQIETIIRKLFTENLTSPSEYKNPELLSRQSVKAVSHELTTVQHSASTTNKPRMIQNMSVVQSDSASLQRGELPSSSSVYGKEQVQTSKQKTNLSRQPSQGDVKAVQQASTGSDKSKGQDTGNNIDHMMGDAPGKGSDLSKVTESLPSKPDLSFPKSTKHSPLVWEKHSTTEIMDLPSQSVDESDQSALGSPSQSSQIQGHGANRSRQFVKNTGKGSPVDDEQTGLDAAKISTVSSAASTLSGGSVGNKIYSGASTAVSFTPSAEPTASLDADNMDSMNPTNESYHGPKGEEIGSDNKEQEEPEKIAFNFIISALVALSMFGCAVLGIIFMRRWQQKGSYTLNNEDTEMNNLDIDIMEAAAAEKPEIA
ncbi:uncharacterized protein LOC143299833 [Babylonia areolata]|uniref:uncharacterized protein LOC143299833 n=1 Tax=Babylonia areolata TaxID=304850 RepID=UPI003FD47D82